MIIEILITASIFAFAGFMLYKNFKKSKSGSCGCDGCSSSTNCSGCSSNLISINKK
ncbi:FeoB-associated Cys-rich membrane protein [Desnuesiella massiliensis]|uniref:FeoB-associated Cys-rich membrane protein n=1 Tax=Desnuesiella massiliensis TaxID=1650662 RepID=UPI00093AE10F|nr:FeoB-associated Cys-rich membrane protein [Desnuesiella massiliensis]